VLVVDTSAPPAILQACRALATALADETGVTLTLVALDRSGLERLRSLVREAGDGVVWERIPPRVAAAAAPMAAAPFVWRQDGRPDWGAMWTTFCELALYGGPPHRGEENPLRAPEVSPEASAADREMVEEIRRGIWETTGLFTEAAGPGWIAVTCRSRRMAAWLCAAIILENVEARCEEERLLLPAGPGYQLQDQVKSVITVAAKTHHYWQAHIAAQGGARATRATR